MRTSITELKSFRECKRKWYFSGRNGMYLRPMEKNNAFKVGSAFHEVIDNLYRQTNYDLDLISDKHYLEEEDKELIDFHIEKYKDEVLEKDLEIMDILYTEAMFEMNISSDINIFGFIDLVYQNKETKGIGVLEHKFLRSFRPEIYNALDEQLKMYEVVIDSIEGSCEEGISVNQVRKLKTKFDHQRVNIKQTKKQREKFLEGITKTAEKMKLYKDNGVVDYEPTPHWMDCNVCAYKELCLKMEQEGTNDTRIITLEFAFLNGLECLHDVLDLI